MSIKPPAKCTKCRCCCCTMAGILVAVIAAIAGILLYDHFSGSHILRDGFWETTKLGIRATFPDVEHVKTSTVLGWIQGGDKLVIVDARAFQEYNVSHIESAINIPTNSSDEEIKLIMDPLLLNQPKSDNQTTVVVYCSAGYRSAIMARSIKRLYPDDHIVSMIGSIFEWVNDGYGYVVDSNGQPTKGVHPYDNVFGQLLDGSSWQWN